MPSPTLKRLLVVEDNGSLCRAYQAALAGRAAEIRIASSVGEARAALETFQPELLVLDVALPDGNALQVLEAAARMGKVPAVVAVSGTAGPDESFRLAQMGVRVYLKKPVSQEALCQAVDQALSAPPDLTPLLRATVGHRAVHEVEAEVRQVMVREALARADGSRRGAAKLLAISRQLLQHILRRMGADTKSEAHPDAEPDDTSRTGSEDR